MWGFFHANPRGVYARRLAACNVAILVLGIILALAAAIPLYGDALAQRPDSRAVPAFPPQRGMSVLLAAADALAVRS